MMGDRREGENMKERYIMEERSEYSKRAREEK